MLLHRNSPPPGAPAHSTCRPDNDAGAPHLFPVRGGCGRSAGEIVTSAAVVVACMVLIGWMVVRLGGVQW